MNTSTVRHGWQAARLLITLAAGGWISAEASANGLYINEIYFNPPAKRHPSTLDPDLTHQYVELRGTPLSSLDDHYFVVVENEDDIGHNGGAGLIEAIWDLSAYSLGVNGYITAMQKDDPHAQQYRDYPINPLSTNVRNTGTGVGFGTVAGSSSIGFTTFNDNPAGLGGLEGSGFTAFLIRTDGQASSVPELNDDVDVGNNGLDMPIQPDGTGVQAGWTILDSISVFGEGNEAEFGRAYAPLVYGFEPANLVTGLEPGAQYVFLDWPELEAEYVGRWANSTGHAPADWHVSNLTNDSTLAGFTNNGDFRQSSEPHGSNNPADLESSLGVPYGTNLTSTVGGPNYPLNLLTPTPGDFDGDGDVDGDDLECQWMPRFGDGPGRLNGQDFLVWQRNLGTSPPAASASGAVPEPTAVLLSLAVSVLLSIARLRFRSAARAAPPAPYCA